MSSFPLRGHQNANQARKPANPPQFPPLSPFFDSAAAAAAVVSGRAPADPKCRATSSSRRWILAPRDGGEPGDQPHGRPPRRDPTPPPGPLPVSLQVRLPVLARPHLRPCSPQQATPNPSWLLLQQLERRADPQHCAPLHQHHRKRRAVHLPLLLFLARPSGNVTLLDSCNGLLLCCFQPDPHEGDRFPPFHYDVCNPGTKKWVCNPATKKWVMLPDAVVATGEAGIPRLGFDPAVSSHFHVVKFVYEEECVTGVEIDSSKSAAWSFKESEWGDDVMLNDEERSVFLNGFMHILYFSDGVAVVDMEGKTWRTIPAPHDCGDGYIHQSQGHLCFLNVHETDPSKLSIWILEDYGSDEWILKHSVRTQFLFGKHLMFDLHCTEIAFHPECNLIYFVYGSDNTLMAYDMDRKEVCVICNLGRECREPYLPYVPWFAEALADGQ